MPERPRSEPTGSKNAGDGLRPRFEIDVMIRTLREMLERSTWADWEAVACPVLIVRAERGIIEPQVVEQMRARRPGTNVVELPKARHDLHLDQPRAWRRALAAFLTEVDGQHRPQR